MLHRGEMQTNFSQIDRIDSEFYSRIRFGIKCRRRFASAIAVIAMTTVCIAGAPRHQTALKSLQSTSERGVASYYGEKYQSRPTASGEPFDWHQLTAAHPSLPFGTLVKVTNLENNRSVTVRVNDRGPFVAGRVIDLSQSAAEQLQMIQKGLARVQIEAVR